MWDELKGKIGKLSSFKNLIHSLRKDDGMVCVNGLYGSSRSLVLATMVDQYDGPYLVITPDPVSARDVSDDLRIFGVKGVCTYPEDEILPYDYHDPDRDITGQQMETLASMIGGDCGVLVTTVRSLLKKVFAPELFTKLIFSVSVGDEYDPYSLMNRFADLGYEKQTTVEEKGQMAQRGGIIDVFEVSRDLPLRLEFDGDEIFSVREFDLDTQRSKRECGMFTVHPACHIVSSIGGTERLRKRLEKETADLNEDERSRLMLPVERMERGISFFGMDHYAADIHDLKPLYSYFSTPPVTVAYQGDKIVSSVQEFRDEIEDRHRRSREEGNLYPLPSEVYIGEAEYNQWFDSTGKLHFYGIKQKGAISFSTRPPAKQRGNIKGLLAEIKKQLNKNRRVYIFCEGERQMARTDEILEDLAVEVDLMEGNLSGGFVWPEVEVFFLSDEEMFGKYHRPYRSRRSNRRSLTYDHSHFQPGDFVVHLDHGIGRYMGMRLIETGMGQRECLTIKYQGDDHLFIPVERVRMLEKYVAAEEMEPKLDKLGSAAWDRARKKARKSAEEMARDLIEVYAARQISEGFSFSGDTHWQMEMEASFPYQETPHQLRATEEVKQDMERKKPMDRLLCGDVGFGKTEVAIRAAFKSALDGKQSAFLVPTTVLAMQHYVTLKNRLSEFPVNISVISRFLTPAQQKKAIRELAEGKVDIVVGTHRLLSKDVQFSNLGLLVIDEEHRFGVRHKEKFKKIKKNVDVLSMTATPIPRTLSMAISGLRDMSVIDTPPRNRFPIHTEILPFNDQDIRESIMREVNRGGQVFFVHNRVRSIEVMEGYLKRLLPETVKVSHSHGQMSERKLEQKMIDFTEGLFDVLVCTMIIEAGLDFPNVNTIIINRADKFGLAQLYQLRGRVGRSDRKAYACLLVPPGKALTEAAVRRLQAISEFDYLGAGYRLAIRDLEIRGAGNFLGPQQSGHVNAVGLDLYTRMLREEIDRLRGRERGEEREVRISIPVPSYFPSGYIPDSEERMNVYRRLVGMKEVNELVDLEEELKDRFGALPKAAENILKLIEIKMRARRVNLEKLELKGSFTIKGDFRKDKSPNSRALGALAEKYEKRLIFKSDENLSFSVDLSNKNSYTGRGDKDWEAAIFGEFESLLKILETYGN
jgi:transcription-repair coupling factor (superfamily II helicase)